MKHIFFISLLLPSILFSQVKVRGYTKKDGTYVQPHQRTKPDNTKTNNYSYPGNYNPNQSTTVPNYYSYNSPDETTAQPIGFWRWMLYIGLTIALTLGIYYGGMALFVE